MNKAKGSLLGLALTGAGSVMWENLVTVFKNSWFSCASPVLIEKLRACVDGLGCSHGHAHPLAQFEDRPDDGLELHRTSRFVILQHRRLVRPDFFGAGHPLVDGNGELDPQLRCYRFGFGHDRSNEA